MLSQVATLYGWSSFSFFEFSPHVNADVDHIGVLRPSVTGVGLDRLDLLAPSCRQG